MAIEILVKMQIDIPIEIKRKRIIQKANMYYNIYKTYKKLG
jgi:hypothetical protein